MQISVRVYSEICEFRLCPKDLSKARFMRVYVQFSRNMRGFRLCPKEISKVMFMRVCVCVCVLTLYRSA